jgi:hypothetical protein
MHENPISPLNHLSGDLGIPGLIWVPEIPSTNIKEIEDETDSYQEGDLDPFLRIDFRNSLLMVYHLQNIPQGRLWYRRYFDVSSIAW